MTAPRPLPQTDPIDRTGLRPRFWEVHALADLTRPEWEALCDGCGKCCLNKLEDEETARVELTRISCRLLDNDTCHCSKYLIRHQYVPECITLTPGNIADHAYWMPATCAYRLLWQGKRLYDWHPLISGDSDSVHRAGVTMRGRMVSEATIADEDWEDHIIEEPT